MKKIIVLLLTLLQLGSCMGALAGATFAHNAYVGFKGEKLTMLASYDGKNDGQMMTICDETGAVIGERELSSTSGFWRVDTLIPVDAPAGQTITLYINGEKQDTALLASETRPGYSVVRVDRDDKKIAITFDAANAASKTAKILDVLDKYNAKCTFFVIGRYVINNPALVREMEERGHELAGHSWNHSDMLSLTNDQILNDFSKVSAAFVEVLGHDVTLYRPPSGFSSQRDRAVARALGMEVIKWTVDSHDGFSNATLSTVIKSVQNNAGSGDIVLMHVYGKHTLAALETLLPWYMDQGYEFVTVSDLLLKGDTVIDADGVQRYRAKETEK